ncbi:DUF1212-domain-containing protein [Laetiporus sulphureus 93-53]|uniref:DUF1212-domain-containing protein n=1 Tax=Laetiporus sulphureus 93-53 TaxID=1314785 RepID=A0A165HDR5_9APHY|nr:DUF1212-domain-containing protein [Laetiporus sulphureus 93-53]KZT11599.1 DUF1212-domain-containing protein [Laetiporus sulphureus 93-53]
MFGSVGTHDGQDRMLDPDDPDITGIRKERLDDLHHDEKHKLRLMSYRERRKYLSRARVVFNKTTVGHRQNFILTLAKALVKYGAPSHRIESQLLSAGKILDLKCEFVHLPTVIIATFNADLHSHNERSEVHFIPRKGSLSLGALHLVHQIYRGVVHDEISAKDGVKRMENLFASPPVYGLRVRALLSFLLAACICPLAFGGSFADMWLAGVGALVLFFVQTFIASKAIALYANIYDVTVTVGISFVARALSSIRTESFCYTSISSAGIVGILPGFLILCSSLELGSKNIVCGSVNMVYALIYTLTLGFGLQLGSDLFLLVHPSARDTVVQVVTQDTNPINGIFMRDFGLNATNMLNGAFTFSNTTPVVLDNVVMGCYRPDNLPWYFQAFPWWSEFFLVPGFAILLSLANAQPWMSWDFLVMILISIVSYLANKVANHFIFNHSDIVSSIGAFAVGLLGNIYSRQFGGTAFTVMVPGVLFLVPSGLSQAGGITAQGDGIEIGYAMITVTVGITVGLFLSQALVYLFGSRKNAAIFSF